MKSLFKKHKDFIPMLLSRCLKNCGFIFVGISVATFVEYGFSFGSMALFAESLGIVFIAYLLIRQASKRLGSKIKAEVFEPFEPINNNIIIKNVGEDGKICVAPERGADL